MIFFSGKTFTMLVTSTLLSLILVFLYMYIVFESCKKEEKNTIQLASFISNSKDTGLSLGSLHH